MTESTSVPDFYLASGESYAFQGPFTCRVERIVADEGRDDYLVVAIEPPAVDAIIGEPLPRIVLLGRDRYTNPLELPTNVYIFKINDLSDLLRRGCTDSNVELITQGDIFETLEEALALALDM